MINKTEKLDYIQKEVSFMGNGELCDKNGEIFDLVKDLEKVFGDKEFSINCSCSSKESFEIGDL